MNKNVLRRIAALIVCLCLLPAAALAFNNYHLDVDQLKAVEQKDEFPVRITRKLVNDGASGDSYNNRDVLSFEITNNASYEVTQVIVLAVCHDAEGNAQRMTSSGISLVTMDNEKRALLTLTYDVTIAPGATVTVSNECDHGQFTGVRALVAQVTAADGTAYTNPLYEEWQEVALGSPTHILD